MTEKLRILIVNDDGIDSPGLALLEEAAREISDDVWVVAPQEEASGAGHSMSISHPIRVRQRNERHFALRGSPTDCVLMGVYELLGERGPDMILSGVNRGPNLAEDVTYSGTASAAMEGAMLGIPSIALSQIIRYKSEVHWETARRFAPLVIRRLLGLRWRRGLFVNVNFPDCPPDNVQGVIGTRQGLRPEGAFRPAARIDERHVPYYWIKINFPEGGQEPGNDIQAALDHMVSVTPMQLDMTAHGVVEEVAALFGTA